MLPSGLPDTVDDDESIARFVTSRSQYNTRMVKGSAFVPPRSGELSVCRHNGKPDDELRALSKEYIKERTVYGAAVVTAREIRIAGLQIEAKEPPRFHANVIQWPDHKDPEEQVLLRKETAALIAEKADFVKL